MYSIESIKPITCNKINKAPLGEVPYPEAIDGWEKSYACRDWVAAVNACVAAVISCTIVSACAAVMSLACAAWYTIIASVKSAAACESACDAVWRSV